MVPIWCAAMCVLSTPPPGVENMVRVVRRFSSRPPPPARTPHLSCDWPLSCMICAANPCNFANCACCELDCSPSCSSDACESANMPRNRSHSLLVASTFAMKLAFTTYPLCVAHDSTRRGARACQQRASAYVRCRPARRWGRVMRESSRCRTLKRRGQSAARTHLRLPEASQHRHREARLVIEHALQHGGHLPRVRRRRLCPFASRTSRRRKPPPLGRLLARCRRAAT